MPSKLTDYEILYMIGSGSYGKCLKVRRKSDEKILVWKDMDYGSMTEPEKQQLVSEVNLLRELKHRYIVRYHDRIIDRSKSRLYLIMEYCAGGDLASLITKCRKDRCFLEEDFIIKILTQLGLALQACHTQRHRSGNQGKVLHRDLKPANVFLDENRDVKLGDFGLARVLQHDTSFAKTFVGTPYYMSPEQMSKNHYNEKSDIWSLGCLVYELCALVPPFTAPNQRLLAEKIKQGQFRRVPSRYSESLQDCIASMLRLTSSSRPSLTEILRLPLLKDSMKRYGDSKEVEKPVISPILSDVKADRRRSSSSSGSSVADGKRDPPFIDLQAREKALDERIREVERKERNLLRKERNLEDREKAAEDKMKTAEALIRQYKEMRADHNMLCMVNGNVKYGLDGNKKQVHFATDAKENDPSSYAIDKYRYGGNGKKDTITKTNVGDYRRKLQDLHLYNDVENNKYKPLSQFNSEFKSRQVLGMR